MTWKAFSCKKRNNAFLVTDKTKPIYFCIKTLNSRLMYGSNIKAVEWKMPSRLYVPLCFKLRVISVYTVCLFKCTAILRDLLILGSNVRYTWHREVAVLSKWSLHQLWKAPGVKGERCGVTLSNKATNGSGASGASVLSILVTLVHLMYTSHSARALRKLTSEWPHPQKKKWNRIGKEKHSQVCGASSKYSSSLMRCWFCWTGVEGQLCPSGFDQECQSHKGNSNSLFASHTMEVS